MEDKIAAKGFGVKPGGNRPTVKCTGRAENIKMDLKQRGQDDVYYSHLSQDTEQVGVPCEHGNGSSGSATNFRVPQ